MRHVEGLPGQRLDRRPPASMPEGIEHGNRPPPVDRGHLVRQTASQAVLPGAAEDGDRDRSSCGGSPRQRFNQAVDVLTDPGPLAKRGSVIDQDTHVMGGDGAALAPDSRVTGVVSARRRPEAMGIAG